MALFVRQGMALWLSVFSQSAAAIPQRVPTHAGAEPRLPWNLRGELVRILTTMTLGCWQERRA
jgi:hypothetical protein